MAYAIDPSIATQTRRLHLAVETESELTRGMVAMDLLVFTGNDPNAWSSRRPIATVSRDAACRRHRVSPRA